VRLEDVDMGESFGFDTNDPVGSVTLTSSDLLAALRAGGTHQVPVAHRSAGKILFIAIAVRPE
jgi:hypothetical protein